MSRIRIGSKRWLAGFLLALLCAILAQRGWLPERPPQRSGPRGAPPERMTAMTLEVKDGDSLVVDWDGRPLPIRLFGIDCPEQGQAGSSQARAFTREFALGRRLEIRSVDQDRYGRDVALVHAGQRCLNAELVRAGWAWAYRRYSDRFVPEETEARDARRGLWKEPGAEPPWQYRKRNPRRPEGDAPNQD